MPKLTDLQLSALVFLLDEAKGRDWAVPSAKQLAAHLRQKPVEEITASESAAALNIINRLQKNYKCFFFKGKLPKRRVVRNDSFVTEPSSAHYVITLRRLCRSDPNRCTTKGELHRVLADESQTDYSPAVLEQMFRHSRRGKYIGREVDTLPGQIRLGARVEDLLPYLEVLDGRMVDRAQSFRAGLDGKQ